MLLTFEDGELIFSLKKSEISGHNCNSKTRVKLKIYMLFSNLAVSNELSVVSFFSITFCVLNNVIFTHITALYVKFKYAFYLYITHKFGSCITEIITAPN